MIPTAVAAPLSHDTQIQHHPHEKINTPTPTHLVRHQLEVVEDALLGAVRFVEFLGVAGDLPALRIVLPAPLDLLCRGLFGFCLGVVLFGEGYGWGWLSRGVSPEITICIDRQTQRARDKSTAAATPGAGQRAKTHKRAQNARTLEVGHVGLDGDVVDVGAEEGEVPHAVRHAAGLHLMWIIVNG